MCGRPRLTVTDVTASLVILALTMGLIVGGGFFAVWLSKEAPRLIALGIAILCALTAVTLPNLSHPPSPSLRGYLLVSLSAPFFSTAFFIGMAESAAAISYGTFASYLVALFI
jgi:hypothetical protein